MRFGGRPLGTIVKAPFEKRHRTAAINIFRRYPHPIDILKRYLLTRGEYPATIPINTPSGQIALTAYNHHDILTINEIFCRLDYRADDKDTVIVDFGSNIGISAAYFLTTSPKSRIYLFEPLSSNTERLKKNLEPFKDRYELSQVAVGLTNGEVEFGWEETGRYGGVGRPTGNYISVPCVDSNQILNEVLNKHGHIDVLKIDIETLEEAVTIRIPDDFAAKIKNIYVEFEFAVNPLERTHSLSQYGTVAQFTSRRNVLAT
jgi:FkbM family methyltransferase